MISLRNFLIFLAGAAFFHTVSHIVLPYYITLPFEFNGFTLTAVFNNWIIAVSAAITVALLWGASQVKTP